MSVVELAQLTYPEAQAILQQGAVALWPTGSTEAHGPHLPLQTDVTIATESARRGGAEVHARLGLHAVIMPALSYTITEYASPFSGTISISKQTTLAYVKEVILSAASQGFKAVCLVNAHLEPAHRFALRDAVKAARSEAPCPISLADPCDRRWVSRLSDEFQSGACHAGQYESSLVMAATPNQVKEQVRAGLAHNEIDLVKNMKAGVRTFDEMGATEAYFGFPAQASAAEGHATYDILADIVATVVAEALDASTEGSTQS